jgi:hypothetical protein
VFEILNGEISDVDGESDDDKEQQLFDHDDESLWYNQVTFQQSLNYLEEKYMMMQRVKGAIKTNVG